MPRGKEKENMTMNKKNVRTMLVKLLAGLMLTFMLIGATAPAVLASEEATTEEQTTEAEQEDKGHYKGLMVGSIDAPNNNAGNWE